MWTCDCKEIARTVMYPDWPCPNCGETVWHHQVEGTGQVRQIAITDFLTEVEIERAAKLSDSWAIREQIIAPNMDRINKALGQENDEAYLTYAVEHVLRQTGDWGST